MLDIKDVAPYPTIIAVPTATHEPRFNIDEYGNLIPHGNVYWFNGQYHWCGRPVDD